MADEKLEVLILAKDQASSVFQKIGGVLGGALKVGIGAAVAGLGALATGLGFCINEAMSAETVTAQLEAVLKSTGGAAGVTAQAAQDLANKFSGLTRFEDDAILAGENMLLTFTNIGKNIFPDTTQTMLDMSAALGQDLTASAMQLGKALQDPVAGVTALQRVGVRFTDSQKQMIESLVKAGKVEEAQKMILKELQTEFGGSAEAAGQTFAGKLDILKNKLGNVAESIGGMVLPMLSELASSVLEKVIPTVEKLGGALPQAFEYLKKGQVGNAVKWIALQLSDLFGPKVTVPLMQFGDTLQSAFDGLKPIFDALITAGQGVITALLPLFQGVGNFIMGLLPALQGFATTVVGVVATFGPPIMTLFTSLSNIFLAVLPSIQGLANAIVNFGTQAVAMVGPFVQDTLAKLGAWFTANGPMIQTILSGIADAVTSAINGVILPAIQAFWSWIEPVLGSLVDFILSIGTSILQMATGDWSGALETMKGAFNKLWESVKEAWNAFYTWFQGVVNALKSWFSSINWAELGDKIVSGIWAGISAGWGWLKTKISGWVDDFLDYIKGLLGIKSPSVVFAGYGNQLMAGLAKGITDAARLPQLALNNVAGALTLPQSALNMQMAYNSAGGGYGGNQVFYIEDNKTLFINSNARSESLIDDFRLMSAWRK